MSRAARRQMPRREALADAYTKGFADGIVETCNEILGVVRIGQEPSYTGEVPDNLRKWLEGLRDIARTREEVQ